jgi:hypothetical protein
LSVSCAAFRALLPTEIENLRVFNYDKRTTTHLIDLRTSYRFPGNFHTD